MEKKSINNLLLINAVHANEEVRFAIVYNHHLENLYIDKPGSQKKGNIYKARVVRLEPSLQAAFVDYGAERHGFLPLKEVTEAVYCSKAKGKHSSNLTINQVLEENQELLIQVDKEERGTKGAALTTQITLAGSYLVLMPNSPKAGGISRRIEGDDRDELRDLLQNLQAPEHMGLIIRTAGVGKSKGELQWDLDILLRLWHGIQQAFQEATAPCLIHQESDIISRAIRDYLRKDIHQIVVDNPAVFSKCQDYIAQIRPEFSDSLTLYTGHTPLFTHYRIESQIETAFQSQVRLPSGGSLVIQPTEALVSIDVNSARDTKSDTIEQTALNTNREAAIEIARQLRLRDLGGLIVVDFIDMMETEHQREIVQIFQNEVQIDKARVQFGRISKFGLLEISRQRLRPSLSEYTQIVCPRCTGLGNIRSVESLSLLILRLITEHAANKNIAEINVQVPNNVAAYLCNEKRQSLEQIETEYRTKIYILPNPHYELPHYSIDIVKEAQATVNKQNSYEKIMAPEADLYFPKSGKDAIDTPAVNLTPLERPANLARKSRSFMKRIGQLLFGSHETEPVAIKHDTKQHKTLQKSTPKRKLSEHPAEQSEHRTSNRHKPVKRSPNTRSTDSVHSSRTPRTTTRSAQTSQVPSGIDTPTGSSTTVSRTPTKRRTNKNSAHHSTAVVETVPTTIAITEVNPELTTAPLKPTPELLVDAPLTQMKPHKLEDNKDVVITIDMGDGPIETLVYDPKLENTAITLKPETAADPAAILEKHRKQKAKQYAAKKQQQRRIRKAPSNSHHHEAAVITFIVDAENPPTTTPVSTITET